MNVRVAERSAPQGTTELLRRYFSRTHRRLSVALSVLLAVIAAVLVGSVAAGLLPAESAGYVAPTVCALLVFLLFWIVLQHIVDGNVFGELGFIYAGWILAYTIAPALAFLGAGIYAGGPLNDLLPEPSQLRVHLWRHVLFGVSVAAGYLFARGRSREVPLPPHEDSSRDNRALIFAAVLLAVVIPSLALFSAPVESYYDNYTRYAHLPWVARKLASIFIRMSLGLYCVLQVFLFRNYNRYRRVIPFVVALICTYEVLYSNGARIQALIVLLQAACLYHFMVRRISLKTGLLAAAALVFVFSAIELVRTLNFDLTSARDAVADGGLQPAGELTSVFFPGFHLYAERAAGTLPPRPWPMLFSDFTSLFTFGDFTKWNPMTWYHMNYFPEAEISPFTLGPIADSAMWGGELDLLLRGLLNGAFFALIMRWFVRNGGKWWGQAIYAYCFATCILTLKYTIFLHLELVEKNLLPVLASVYIARTLRLSRGNVHSARQPLSVSPVSPTP